MVPSLNGIARLDSLIASMKQSPGSRKQISPALLTFVATLKVPEKKTSTSINRNKTSKKNKSNTYASSTVSFTSDSSCSKQGEEDSSLNPDEPLQSDNKLQRSRERNRIHARKTRQRKKEQMQTLTNRADELKIEQIRLKQCINEKNTASILVGLFASDCKAGDQQQAEDPRIEALLRRPSDDIPDASKLPELPALILPGQHNAKKHKQSGGNSKSAPADDGIDYTLLGKDRSKCTPAELDRIRKERNRMHAKRTRDRKRFFMEEMAEVCKSLQDENRLLQGHLDVLNGKMPTDNPPASVISPALPPSLPEIAPTNFSMSDSNQSTTRSLSKTSKGIVSASPSGVTFDQISTLLEAASAFSSNVSDSSSSTSQGGESREQNDLDHEDRRQYKRRRLDDHKTSSTAQNVPSTITASTLAV